MRTHEATWMNLEDAMLSERSHTQDGTHRVTPLTPTAGDRQLHRREAERWGQPGGRGGLKGLTVPLGGNALKLASGVCCTASLGKYMRPLDCTVYNG